MHGHEHLPAPVEPVYDGELVNDRMLAPRHRPRSGWFRSWWSRSPWVPMWLKSRRHAAQTGKELAVVVLRSPLRYFKAVVRGLLGAVRWWRRWVTVRDYREAAVQQEKLADKYLEIRRLTLFRWKVTGAFTVAFAVALAVAEFVYDEVALWIATIVASAALAVLGRRRDGSSGRKAVLTRARALSWTMDPQLLIDAFRDAKLIGKDETLRLVERATRVGQGWALTVDLPATRKAADVIKHREALASALAVDEVQLIVERVRGRGGHAGRVALWVADRDPYATPPARTPLLEVAR